MSDKQWRQKRPAISVPGNYDTTVIVAEFDVSSTGNPMFVAVFETDDKKTVRSFFTKHELGIKALNELKAACGVDEKAVSTTLLGKKVSVVCGLDKPTVNKDGLTVQYIKAMKYLPLGAPENTSPADDFNW